MPNIIQIRNKRNNHILRCKLCKEYVNLGILNGKQMTGISISPNNFLQRTPAADLFIKKAMDSDFKPAHIKVLDNLIKNAYCKRLCQ